MSKLTKYSSFDALKQAETFPIVAESKKMLALETEQAAIILHKLRQQRQQKNVRKQ